MSLRTLLAGFLLAIPAFPQADACRAALSALNRVKEEIRPGVNDRSRLETWHSTLVSAGNVCKSATELDAELLYFRAIIAQHLILPDSAVKTKPEKDRQKSYQKDFSWSMEKLGSGYKPAYDPFSAPSSAQTTTEQFSSAVRKKWALVVGLDRFQDPTIPALSFAVKDSTDFVKFLLDKDGGRFETARIRHLTNEKATWAGIREGIGWLRANVQPDDLVVVYFSSHGSPRETDPNGVSYIISYDSQLDDPARQYASSVQMIDLVQSLNREIKARRVVLFLDTCYSGDAVKDAPTGGSHITEESGSRTIRPVWTNGQPPASEASAGLAFSGALQALKTGVGRAVLTASRANEQSWENTRIHNGYFTYYLIEALRADRGMKPLGDLYATVRQKVQNAVDTEKHHAQTPSAEFSELAASIVIGIPETP